VDTWKTLLGGEIRSAMSARNRDALAAFRETLGAIDNAEAQPVGTQAASAEGPIAGSSSGLGAGDLPRRRLAPEAVRAIVENEIRERLEAAAGYERMGRKAEAEVLTMQAALLTGLMDTPEPTAGGSDGTGTPDRQR
jgi:uncharacterized protein YqeY